MANKSLVTYFSASGVTKKVAQKLAEAARADLFEIKPEVPYTSADLNWMDKKSRSSVEMNDKSFRPAIAEKCGNMSEYDVVYVGFPIWWYVAPKIINSFLEEYDLSGKRIVVSYTSGGSSLGNTIPELEPSAPGAEFIPGVRFSSSDSEEDIKSKLNI